MKTCGAKEGSGYTHSYNDEPITFVPGNPHKNDRPVSRRSIHTDNLSQFMRSCYLSHMRAAKAQTSLYICAVSSEPSLLAHTK